MISNNYRVGKLYHVIFYVVCWFSGVKWDQWWRVCDLACYWIYYVIGVTVLLSLTVFQDSISEKMPITSLQIPLLGINCSPNPTSDPRKISSHLFTER